MGGVGSGRYHSNIKDFRRKRQMELADRHRRAEEKSTSKKNIKSKN